jgi:hypothetical protein
MAVQNLCFLKNENHLMCKAELLQWHIVTKGKVWRKIITQYMRFYVLALDIKIFGM